MGERMHSLSPSLNVHSLTYLPYVGIYESLQPNTCTIYDIWFGRSSKCHKFFLRGKFHTVATPEKTLANCTKGLLRKKSTKVVIFWKKKGRKSMSFLDNGSFGNH
jgi:hypothetical protein